MRLLHTSDWHLGHTLHDVPRDLETNPAQATRDEDDRTIAHEGRRGIGRSESDEQVIR